MDDAFQPLDYSDISATYINKGTPTVGLDTKSRRGMIKFIIFLVMALLFLGCAIGLGVRNSKLKDWRNKNKDLTENKILQLGYRHNITSLVEKTQKEIDQLAAAIDKLTQEIKVYEKDNQTACANNKSKYDELERMEFEYNKVSQGFQKNFTLNKDLLANISIITMQNQFLTDKINELNGSKLR